MSQKQYIWKRLKHHQNPDAKANLAVNGETLLTKTAVACGWVNKMKKSTQ